MDMPATLNPADIIAQMPGRQANLKVQDNEAARKAAEDFESIYIQQFVETMWSGVEVEEPFGGGNGEKVFRSLLNEQYSKSIASQGGIGLADNVYREIIKMQSINP